MTATRLLWRRIGFQQCNRAIASYRRHLPGIAEQQRMLEERWLEFFSDPSQWWDNRFEKGNPKYPDFKHKKTQESLWLNNVLTPPWVEGKLAEIEPGTLQVDTFSWNKRLTSHLKAGECQLTLQLFEQMQREGINPDTFTYVQVLKACSTLGALGEGRLFHQQMIQNGLESNVYVASCLVDMYAKCGSIEDAWIVFKEMPTRDVVTWNAMIHGYSKCGEGEIALELYRQMHRERVDPNPVTFVGILKACASVGALEEGRHIHKQIIERGYESDVFVGSGLIDMYGKCGSIEDALRVFKKMPTKDAVTWNAMILGYVKCGEGQKALELSRQMGKDGIITNSVTFVGLLNACASVAALEEGRRVHKQISERGYESDVFVGTSLIDMYAKCASIEDAWKVFSKIPSRDVVTWNAMILGYVKVGEEQKALELYRQMEGEGVDPNPVTFVGLLNACAGIASLEDGRCIHQLVIERGYESDLFVGNSLVDMYVKCGSMEDARRMFNKMHRKDVVTWNSMILGYAKHGEGQKALELSHQMDGQGVDPNNYTFVGLVNACAIIGMVEEGRDIHKQIIDRGFESDIFVGNSLIDMYARCGIIEDAWRVFKKMPKRDEVTWNAMILGYGRCGKAQEALELCQEMNGEGLEPNLVTFIGLLNSCASIAAIEEGRRIHKQITRRGYESDIAVGNSLIDMYAKCAAVEDALRVFQNMPTRDVVTWTAMLTGFAMHGFAKEALELFERMCQKDVKVDRVTFMSLLFACSHGGLVDEGLHHFENMRAVCNISPTVEHYACVVDLLGRAGCLHEAQQLIWSMPFEPECSVWNSLLGSCRVHGNMDIASKLPKSL